MLGRFVTARQQKGITVARFTSMVDWILRLPLLWGGVAALAYYALLNQGIIHHPQLVRYTASHPIEYCEVTLFFIGLAAVAMRAMNLGGQFWLMGRATLGAVPYGGQRPDDCESLLQQLRSLPRQVQQTYLARRLREAIEFVRRRNSAADLDDHMRHVEELESIEIQSGYSMIRIIVWAIPILGLLGTVIGITMAVANLKPDTLEQSMSKVTHGLGVAFDHTATALALTMVLMFAKSGVEWLQDRLLSIVDARTSEELVGRFHQNVGETDPNVAAIRAMSEQVVDAVEALASRQADVWRSSIDETHHHWAEMNAATGRLVRDTFSDSMRDNIELHANTLNSGAAQHAEKLDRCAQETIGRLRDGMEKLAELLVDALHRHGEVLTRSENDLAQANRQHLSEVEAALGRSMVVAAERQENLVLQSEQLLKEMQIALVEAAGTTLRQQEELVRQGDVLLKVVNATGQIKKLEGALNHNLAAVQRACNFEEMALNLSAAIQLLCARAGHLSLSARNMEVAGDEIARGAA
jgi:biopolymer transport protein ExbB/TolQ